MSDEDLMKSLQEDESFNPWLKFSRKWRNSFCDSYCLEGDANRIKRYHGAAEKEDRSKKELELHLDVLPQPFVGTPKAGIWLMFKNPGWTEWDEYDHNKKPRIREEMREWASQQEEDAMFEKRRELMFDQYRFALKDDEMFYVLHDAFRTKKDGVGRTEGAYRWYVRNIFHENGLVRQIKPGLEEKQYLSWCSKNLFVLDYIPYHSSKFCDVGADMLKQPYWVELVKHGLDNGKLMVFWGSKILNRVKAQFKEEYAEAAKSGRIAILRGQRAVLKEWNLVFACDPLGERVKAFLK